jgi:hypothetical protein
MTIALFVDDIETVDESLREEYIQGDDGRYVLRGMADTLANYVKVDDIESHEKTQGLVSALDKERERAKTAERRARELEDQHHGMTEEEKKELETLRTARAEAEERRRRQEGEFDKWREEIAEKHSAETKGLAEENVSLKGMIKEKEVSLQIESAMNEFGGRAQILEPLIRRYVKSEIDENGVSIAVTDAEGTRMLNGEGAPLSIRDYVERMSTDKEFGDLFKSNIKSGGGSDGDATKPGGESDSGTPQDAKRMEELSSIANPNAHQRLELARLKGTAPTSEQIKEHRAKTA